MIPRPIPRPSTAPAARLFVALLATLTPCRTAHAAHPLDYGRITHWVSETRIVGDIQDLAVSGRHIIATAREPGDLEISKLVVFDIRDREHPVAAGAQNLRWDATDDAGRPLPAGVYFYELRVGPSTERGKVVRLRR